MYYLHDETGAPIGMQYRTSNYASQVFDAYFFEKNVQGDIIGVYNSTGKKIGAYTYDAWGKCSLSGANGNTILEDKVVAFYNPFRYRGYYYDYETGFYYLQSRYYNPEWGRFLNADGYINANGDITGFNMFAYCSNNPVMGYDPTGEWDWGKFWDSVVSFGATVAGGAAAIKTGAGIFIATGNVGLAVAGGAAAGTAVTGMVNNAVNAVYYEFSDGKSNLTSDSYVDRGYLTRWERLDYSKQQTGERHYNLNAWRYNSEYSLHMYGWFATGWADGKEIPVFSSIALSCKDADIAKNKWDERFVVNLGTIIIGVLGY